MLKTYLYNLATDRDNGPWARIVKCFLFLVSLLYGFIVIILGGWKLLRKRRLGCKVISVGNITLGGTGKTPLVELIAAYLKKNGRKTAVLSRGYKRKKGGQENAASAKGDEPAMMQSRLGDIPVVVDSDRIRAAKAAVDTYGIDTVIMDDGFQQWHIKKDLEIVAVNSPVGFGNARMIPRGILREPVSSLRRADVCVLTKTDRGILPGLEDMLKKINPSALIVKSIHAPVGFYPFTDSSRFLAVDAFKGKTIAVLSGIGDPDSFEGMLTEMGMHIGASFRYPDHHAYSLQDVQKINAVIKEKAIETLVTTEKDAVRLRPVHSARSEHTAPFSVFVLRIELRLTENAERFYKRLLELYRH